MMGRLDESTDLNVDSLAQKTDFYSSRAFSLNPSSSQQQSLA